LERRKMKLLFENWRRYLNEWTAPQYSMTTDTTLVPRVDTEPAPEEEDIGAFRGHQVFQGSTEDPWDGVRHTYSVISNDGNTLAALQVVAHEEGVRVKYAKKEPNINFHMSEFYEWLLPHVGAIYSDPSQTPEGEKIWQHLKKAGHNIQPYDMPGGLMGGWKLVK